VARYRPAVSGRAAATFAGIDAAGLKTARAML
jgi:hypothetical protein